MKQWDKINWPALNRRAREIETSLWRWSLEQNHFKEKGAIEPTPPADYTTTQALMVWCDDGGPAA